MATTLTLTDVRQPIAYRYFCPACTGRAMYAAEPTEFNQITCLHCHAVIGYDANNWFLIDNEQELAKVNS